VHWWIICEDHFWFEVALLALRCPQVLLVNRHLRVCVRLHSPSQTAISGYAGLLQSLRSNIVSPHTHSCRFLGGFIFAP
jgi:hypothetical protein